MNSRNRLNLGLLVVVAVLVVIAVFEPGKQAPPAKPHLLKLDRTTITSLAIKPRGKAPTRLERKEGVWWITEPRAIPAAEFRVNGILSIPDLEAANRFPYAGADLAYYGLDEPALSLTLNDSTTLEFGGRTPLDSQRYLHYGDYIYIVTDSHFAQLNSDYTGFADRRLLPEGTKISALKLPRLTLRHAGESWQAEPKPEDYSADRATALLDAWRYNQAFDVRRLEKAAGTETIEVSVDGTTNPLHFTVEARAPDLVLGRPDLGLAYHFAASAADNLLQLPVLPKTDEAPSAAESKE